MSDIAPFVAAAIRDRTIQQLQEELEAGKAKSNKLEKNLNNALARMIRITGPGGSPAYAEQSFLEAERYAGEDAWQIDLVTSTENGLGVADRYLPRNPALSGCKIEDVYKCELHIGAKRVIKLSEHTVIDSVSYPSTSDHRISVSFPADSDSGVARGALLIDFGGPDAIAVESEFPHGFFPEYYSNDQVEYLNFVYVDFQRHPFDREEEEGDANQNENGGNNEAE